MDGQVREGNAFAVLDLWGASRLAQLADHAADTTTLRLEPLSTPLLSQLLVENLEVLHSKNYFPGGSSDSFGASKDIDLRLSDLSASTYRPLEDFGAVDFSSVSSASDFSEVSEVHEEDIWPFPHSLNDSVPPEVKTWETFYDNAFSEPRTLFFSEAGSGVFDVILSTNSEDADLDGPGLQSTHVVQLDLVISSFIQLGLGRNSVLYRYDEHRMSFTSYFEKWRGSGYSLEAFQDLNATFINYGNKTRSLRTWINKAQSSETSFSTRIALADNFSTILTKLQAQLGEGCSSVRSLLQLQSYFERPGIILSCLNEIEREVGGARTDDETLSKLFEYVQTSEHALAWLRPTLFQILIGVSKPWLESVALWLGLEENYVLRCHGRRPSFVVGRDKMWSNQGSREMTELEYEYDPFAMPDFMTEEDGLLIFETGRSLRLLEAYQPRHPLLRPAGRTAPKLEWTFSWCEIEVIQSQAKEYEAVMQKEICDFNHRESTEESAGIESKTPEQPNIVTFKISEKTAKAYIKDLLAVFEGPIVDRHTGSGDPVHIDLAPSPSQTTPDQEVFAPPLALLPTLSFKPLLSSQARLVNCAGLRLLFKEHFLRSHFALLHRYSLFGDGVFSSRLAHALFDPDLNSAKRQIGHSRGGTPGLNLGYRDTWPPASSELRLALMSILTDSYYENAKWEASSMFRVELPGGLSFAIRDMSEEELQRCIDPNSIEALDFLKLQYRAPPPLDVVITQASLAKYDLVFKLLLRVIRMRFVVNQLFRDTTMLSKDRRGANSTFQSFRIESHHFVSAVCGYFFDGVQANWSILEQRLNQVEKSIDRESTSDCDGLYKLRDFHERFLDRLMFSLILRKRQAQVMKLLDEIFGSVLLFARYARTFADDRGQADASLNLEDIYGKFKKKVRLFISVCRGLSERGGSGTQSYDAYQDNSSKDEGRTENGSSTIEQLLLKFEMNGFYTR